MSLQNPRRLSVRQDRPVAAVGVGGFLKEGSDVGADLFRHSMLLIGVIGLVAIAAGALTDCTAYWSILNWVSSCFYRG